MALCFILFYFIFFLLSGKALLLQKVFFVNRSVEYKLKYQGQNELNSGLNFLLKLQNFFLDSNLSGREDWLMKEIISFHSASSDYFLKLFFRILLLGGNGGYAVKTRINFCIGSIYIPYTYIGNRQKINFTFCPIKC